MLPYNNETYKRMYTRQSDTLIEPMPSPPELSELVKSFVNQSSSNIDILRAEADLPKTDMEYVQQFKESEEIIDRIKWVFFSSYSIIQA